MDDLRAARAVENIVANIRKQPIVGPAWERLSPEHQMTLKQWWASLIREQFNDGVTA